MAYCVYSDVGTLLSLTFDESSSVPLASKVTDIISLISSEIDLALLSVGISVPTAGTNLYNVCKLNNMYGAAGVVGMTYNGNKDGVNDTRPDYYRQQYMTFLKNVKDNPELFLASISEGFLMNQITDGTYTESEVTDHFIGNDWTP